MAYSSSLTNLFIVGSVSKRTLLNKILPEVYHLKEPHRPNTYK